MSQSVGIIIRILLVNHSPLLADALALVLAQEPDMEVVGCVVNGDRALRLAARSDVILINARLSDGGALDLIRSVSEAGLPAKILALGLSGSKEQVLQYVEAGAAGYVLRDDSVDDLLAQVRGVHAGQVRVSPGIASALMARVAEYAQYFDQVDTRLGAIADLTPRQQEILTLIGRGCTNLQIARQLVIEVGTVKNHVHNILQKLDAGDRHEAAAAWAIGKDGQIDS